ncbi:MAG: hypothetical protein ACLUAR_13405 [Pilosibacter sp.]
MSSTAERCRRFFRNHLFGRLCDSGTGGDCPKPVTSGSAIWEDHYYTQRVKGRTTGRQIRLPEITSSGWDLPGSYLPYYLLELPDHTYIVAQIPQETAKAIEKGESVALSIGQKYGTDRHGSKSSFCQHLVREYEADMDGVFYAFDSEWQAEHHFLLLLLVRFGAAALLWSCQAVGLTLAGWKLFKSKW